MRQTTDDPAKSWKEFKGPAIDFFKPFSKVKKIKDKIKNLSDSNELFKINMSSFQPETNDKVSSISITSWLSFFKRAAKL